MEELLSFISNPSIQVRTAALSGLVGYCRNKETLQHFLPAATNAAAKVGGSKSSDDGLHNLRTLCDLTCDPQSFTVRKLSLLCLVTLSSTARNLASQPALPQADANSAPASSEQIPLIDGHHAFFEYLVVKCKLVERLMERLVLIMREDNKLVFSDTTSSSKGQQTDQQKQVNEHNELKQMMLLLLSVLTQTEQGQRQLLQIPLVKRETVSKKTRVKSNKSYSGFDEDEYDEESDEDNDADNGEEEESVLQGFYVQKLIELLEYVPLKQADSATLSKEMEQKIQTDPTKWIPNILTNIAMTQKGRDHFLIETDEDALRRVFTYLQDVNPMKRIGISGLIRNCLFEKGKHGYIVDKTGLTKLLLKRVQHESNLTIRRTVAECLFMLTASSEGLAKFAEEENITAISELAAQETDQEIKSLLERIGSARERYQERLANRQAVPAEEGQDGSPFPSDAILPEGGVNEGDLITYDPETNQIQIVAKAPRVDQAAVEAVQQQEAAAAVIEEEQK